MALQNIKIIVEYDGEPFHGWQRQGSLPTIQGEIERCLEEIIGNKTTLYGAGRTDSGVHARGQVANFYVDDSPIPADRFSLALNTKLPFAIRVLKSEEVEGPFHAQRYARGKIYEYRVLNRNFASALDRRVYFYPQPLNWDMIRESLSSFVGEHDFKAFQSAGTPTLTTVRRLERFDLDYDGDGVYRFTVEGNGFLKQMVRNMVGTVLEVGQGLRRPGDIRALFASLDREYAGRTVPARGLCLNEVLY